MAGGHISKGETTDSAQTTKLSLRENGINHISSDLLLSTSVISLSLSLSSLSLCIIISIYLLIFFALLLFLLLVKIELGIFDSTEIIMQMFELLQQMWELHCNTQLITTLLTFSFLFTLVGTKFLSLFLFLF